MQYQRSNTKSTKPPTDPAMAPIWAPVRTVDCGVTEMGTVAVGDAEVVVVSGVGVRVGPPPRVTIAVIVV